MTIENGGAESGTLETWRPEIARLMAEVVATNRSREAVAAEKALYERLRWAEDMTMGVFESGIRDIRAEVRSGIAAAGGAAEYLTFLATVTNSNGADCTQQL